MQLQLTMALFCTRTHNQNRSEKGRRITLIFTGNCFKNGRRMGKQDQGERQQGAQPLRKGPLETTLKERSADASSIGVKRRQNSTIAQYNRGSLLR